MIVAPGTAASMQLSQLVVQWPERDTRRVCVDEGA